MPAYNSGSYISEAIESIIAQTYPHWELIIIDDGSIDNTKKIATKYSENESRVHLISQKNQGVSTARNKGLQKARGGYISFVDSDDRYHPDYLKKLYSKSIKNTSDMVYCSIYHERIDQQVPPQYAEGDVLYEVYAKQKSAISIVSILIRKAYIDEQGLSFDTLETVGEDQLFVIKLLVNKKVSCVSECLYLLP